MDQVSIKTYYHIKKRTAPDDIESSKKKIRHLELETDVNGEKTSVHIKSHIHHNIEDTSVSPDIVLVEESKKRDDTLTAKPSSSKERFSKQTDILAFIKKASNVPKINEFSKSDSLNTARKELNLGDIRKKLLASSRLAQIKAAADRLSKDIPQLLDDPNKRNLKEFKSINVEVPTSPNKNVKHKEFLSPKSKDDVATTSQRPLISPRKVLVSPIKSPTKISAYTKQSTQSLSTTELPLPHHYRFLAEIFRSMETVVSLLYNRNEKITFTKLKPSVQEMLKRNFTQKHLAQIKHLVPDFFTFELQKNNNFNNSSNKDTYEIVISPILPNNLKIMNPSVILERRRYFYERLLQELKKHHAKYLSTLEMPIVIPNEKLVRWHPEFALEKVPDIEMAKLPEKSNKEKFSTAQDVLAKARELFKCNTKMERAMEKLAQAKARGLTEEEKKATGITSDKPKINGSTQTSELSPSVVQILNPALRNLPTSLLEKVKAKQAAKALEAMTRSSEHDKKYLTYSRLPDLARTLRNIFVTERKNVLALNIILSKLNSSFKANVPASQLHNDIKVLTEAAPELIKLHDIRKSSYVKFDKNANLNKIVSNLEALAKKYKD